MGNLENLRLTLNKDDDDESVIDGGGLAVQEEKPKLKKPPLYKVVLLNDDYTPMEFVVEVLETFFAMNREKATHVMLEVHTKGKGVCGVFSGMLQKQKQRKLINMRVKMNIHCCVK
jgi:Uncharacterized conserved protein